MADRARGIQIHRPIVYGSVARLLTPAERALCKDPNHTHTWTVFVRSAASPNNDSSKTTTTTSSSSAQAAATAAASAARDRSNADDDLLPGGADDMSYFLKRVSFRLHDSFPTPLRNIDKPPYQVTETGWGEFPLQIRLTFVPEAVEKPVHILHNLKLHHWVPATTVAAVGVAGGTGGEGGGEGGGEVGGEDGQVELMVVDPPSTTPGSVAGPSAGEGGPSTSTSTPLAADPSAPSEVATPATAAASPAPSAAAPPPPPAEVQPPSTDAPTSTDGAAPSAPQPVDLTPLVDKSAPVPVPAPPPPSSDLSSTPAQAASAPAPLTIAPPTGPVSAYQYDELVFTNPPLAFLSLLQANPPTPLGVQAKASGEFTLGMEREEGERIEEGRREVVRETDGWRKRLIEAEREVARLRAEVGDM